MKIDIKKGLMFKINNLDFAKKGFYINLESSTDRKEQVESLIQKYNIEGLERFDALTDDFIQYSCTKSHLSLFEKCSEENLDVIFVAEDDFFIEDTLYTPYTDDNITFLESLKNVHEDLKMLEWDVIQFGCNPKSHLIPQTNNLAKNYFSTGAWAYLIKKDAYEYILKNLNYRRDYIAIDDYLPLLSKKGFTTLTTIPQLINHSVGFVSTLQPRGPVNYSEWIKGNYHKFLYDHYKNGNFTENVLEKNLTIVIAGHFVNNYQYYLRYLIHSLPQEILRCRFIIHYDETSDDIGTEMNKLRAYFRDHEPNLNVTISSSFGGLISSFNNFIPQITTPYFLFLEHDWVFLDGNMINFTDLIKSFNTHKFINAVWFSKDDNLVRGFEVETDVENIMTPFEKETRVENVDLVTTCRWSNNPVIFRLNKMKEWYDSYIKNDNVGVIHQSQGNVEEVMISVYREEIKRNKWSDIKDNWGTFLYGNLGDGPYVGHTDASQRYKGNIRSLPEENGENYIKKFPSIHLEFEADLEDGLDTFFKKYSTDKLLSGYHETYEKFFREIRRKEISLLEIGLGTLNYGPSNMVSWKEKNENYLPCASLRAFKDYFTEGKIYGMDIQEDCMVQEERITTFLTDSTNTISCDTVLGNLTFDIIIDDGDHSHESQIKTFENLYKRLNDGGFYFIESVAFLQEVKSFFENSNYEYKFYDRLLLINK